MTRPDRWRLSRHRVFTPVQASAWHADLDAARTGQGDTDPWRHRVLDQHHPIAEGARVLCAATRTPYPCAEVKAVAVHLQVDVPMDTRLPIGVVDPVTGRRLRVWAADQPIPAGTYVLDRFGQVEQVDPHADAPVGMFDAGPHVEVPMPDYQRIVAAAFAAEPGDDIVGAAARWLGMAGRKSGSVLLFGQQGADDGDGAGVVERIGPMCCDAHQPGDDVIPADYLGPGRVVGECCDQDCGPCCPDCPTCPTLHPERVVDVPVDGTTR
jgi:hypothetical protein